MRHLGRRVVGPGGRLPLVLAVLAAAWAAWAVLPPWPLVAWEAADESVVTAALSPDGTRVLTAGCTGLIDNVAVDTVRLYDAATGRPVADTGEPTDLRDYQFTPGGRLVVQDAAGVITVRDAADGRVRVEARPDVANLSSHGRREFAVSPDGRWLACELSTTPPTVQLWDMDAGALTAALPAACAPLAFAADGQALATASGDSAPILVWDTVSGRELARPGGDHVAVPAVLAFSPDGRRLAAWPGVINDVLQPPDLAFWDVAAGRPRRMVADLAIGAARACYALWCRVFRGFRSSGASGRRFGDLEHAKSPEKQPPKCITGSSKLAFSPDGRLLVARARGRGVFWDLSADPPRCLDVLLAGTAKRTNPEATNYPLFSADGSRFVVPGTGEAESWVAYDAGTLTRVAECIWPHDLMAFDRPNLSPDGRRLAVSGAGDLRPQRQWEAWLERQIGGRLPWRRAKTYVRFYDLTTGTNLGDVPAGSSLLGFAPGGRSVWTATIDAPNGRTVVRVRQVAVPTGRFPGWLVAVTAAGLCLVAADGWQARRIRLTAGPSAVKIDRAQPPFPKGNPP